MRIVFLIVVVEYSEILPARISFIKFYAKHSADKRIQHSIFDIHNMNGVLI